MARHILLFEHYPNQDRPIRATDEYMLTTNGSLQQKDYRHRTDENGFIRTGRELPADHAPIIVLGDSPIESYFIDEEKRICVVLEEMFQNAGMPIRVLNGGVSGATTLQLFNVLVSKCIPLQPSGIVLMSGCKDMGVRKSFRWLLVHRELFVAYQRTRAAPQT